MIRSNIPENLRHVCVVINFNPTILLYCSDVIIDDNDDDEEEYSDDDADDCRAGNCIDDDKDDDVTLVDDAVLDTIVDAVIATVAVLIL